MRDGRSHRLDPFITLLEVHKLMYFMQEAGEPLQLRFTQALFAAAWRCPEQSGHPLPAIEAATAATNGSGSPACGTGGRTAWPVCRKPASCAERH